MNDKNFEDRERIFDEFKLLFFYILYLWTRTFVSPLVISYHDFLVFFYPFNLVFSHVYFLCT
jgi:hypothetical protein